MAIGMAISVFVETLLHSGGTEGGEAHKPPPKDEKGEWIRNKLKPLSSLPGILGKHCLASLEQFSAGFLIELQM